MVSLLLKIVLSAVMCVANAAPNLQDVSTIDGVKLFRDHQQKQVFYYLKAEKRLMQKEGKPDFRYDVNRYIGTRLTANSDEFRVRGVIKFQTTSAFVNTTYQQVSDELARRNGVAIELRAAPVANSYNKLVYATIESKEGEDSSGEIDGGFASDDPENDKTINDGQIDNVQRVFGSQKQRFTIGLNGHDANFFWENFANNNLQLSLAYGWQIKGVMPAEKSIEDKEKQWKESTYAVNNAMPIDVSPAQYPTLFNKNELWQRTKVAYSNLTIMCYDFINIESSDLYYVQVEVRFTTLRDQQYIETTKFVADSGEYEKNIQFKLANNLKDGYEYRVRRLSTEGDFSQTDWLRNDSPFLDVSLSTAELSVANSEGVNEL